MKEGLETIFEPRSIAVIGASKKKGKIGRELIHNLIDCEFEGKIFPINLRSEVIHSIKCYRSVLAIPDEVDLAVVIVPKRDVLEVVRECAKKEVKAIIVISAGFRETGGAGVELEEKLLELVRGSGMRMIGPNCMGVINKDPNVRMNASFARARAKAGNTAFVSQSGALGEAILEYSKQTNLGISKFVSLGNRADVSSNDLLEYFEGDPQTSCILLYLESFGNPRNFIQTARRVGRKKPIIAVKAGRTQAGAEAASSHTGSLAGLDIAVDALFEECGVIRTQTIAELFDVASLLSNQPLPAGNRVGILTNGGGPAILATDALINRGLAIPHLSDVTIASLRQVLSPDASPANPVDMTGSATHREYGKALESIAADENIDTLMVIVVAPVFLNTYKVAEAIIDTQNAHPEKRVLTCFMFERDAPNTGLELLYEHNIPVYTYPESVASALAAIEKHRAWCAKPEGKLVSFPADKETVEEIIAKATLQQRKALNISEGLAIFEGYGIPVAPHQAVTTQQQAIAAAQTLGYPVCAKLISSKVIHKSDRGGVIIGIEGIDSLKNAFAALKQQFTPDELDGVLIHRMIPDAIETIIGMNMDPTFGPLILFGLGGIYVEVLKDVAFKLHPITDVMAEEMVKSIKGYPILTGIRGQRGANIADIVDAILRISQLVSDFPQIRSLEINPFFASPEPGTSCAVDARVVLQ